MIDSNTSLLEVGLKPIKGMGIHVDIFPLDKIKKEKSFKTKFMRFLFMLRMVPAFMDYKKRVNNKNRIIFIRIVKVLNKVFKFSKGGYYADRFAAKSINKDYAYLGNIINGNYKEVYKKSILTILHK